LNYLFTTDNFEVVVRIPVAPKELAQVAAGQGREEGQEQGQGNINFCKQTSFRNNFYSHNNIAERSLRVLIDRGAFNVEKERKGLNVEIILFF